MLLGIAMCQTTALIVKNIDFDEWVSLFNKSITPTNGQKINVGDLIDNISFKNQDQSDILKNLDVSQEDGNSTSEILIKILKELTYDSPFEGDIIPLNQTRH